jgi:A/G-specific adenine glycosylase
MAFAFNRPTLFVETNIRTVFIHFFFKNRRKVADEEILPLVEQCLYKVNPRVWYWALMDYGALLKKSGTVKKSRSAHYVKQSRFEGSKRQVRGKVLKLLLGRRKLTLRELARLSAMGPKELKGIVDDLAAEGFVGHAKGRFWLRRELRVPT